MYTHNEVIREPMTFGNTLRNIRETDGLTQAEVSARLGMTRAHICDLEKGRKQISPERAARFAEELVYSSTLFVQLALQDQLPAAGLNITVDIQAA